MSLYEKLLLIQQAVDRFVKDNQVGEGKQAYKAVSSEQVLDTVRPLMNEHKLLLIPSVNGANVIVGATSSGTARYLTELSMVMTWHDVESGEELAVPWYGQGVDLAGEKGVGKANTYAEKYFLMKFFHVPTPKDDPDGDKRTQSGEKVQRGTQAEAETLLRQRAGIQQMLDELCGGDEEKVKESLIAFTKNNGRQYPGVDSIEQISDLQVKVVYGKIKKKYEERTGHTFVFKPADSEEATSNAD